MLKTSSTKLAKPKKGVVEIGGGGRNRAEPVNKNKIDRVDDGGSRSDDFNRKFHPLYNGSTTHLEA